MCQKHVFGLSPSSLTPFNTQLNTQNLPLRLFLNLMQMLRTRAIEIQSCHLETVLWLDQVEGTFVGQTLLDRIVLSSVLSPATAIMADDGRLRLALKPVLHVIMFQMWIAVCSAPKSR